MYRGAGGGGEGPAPLQWVYNKQDVGSAEGSFFSQWKLYIRMRLLREMVGSLSLDILDNWLDCYIYNYMHAVGF